MFHPELRLLRCFSAIAELRSITRAAAKLHLSQPTVTGQIRDLERALGFSLFHRTTRSIALTAHGEKLLPTVNSIIDLSVDLQRQVEQLQIGDAQFFRLGAAIYTTSFHDRAALLDDFAMTPAAPSFTIDTRLQSDLVRDLISGRLDAALLMGNAVPVSDEDTWENEIGAITNETQYPESLSRVVIGTRPVGLLIPVQSPLANKHRTTRSIALTAHGEKLLPTVKATSKNSRFPS